MHPVAWVSLLLLWVHGAAKDDVVANDYETILDAETAIRREIPWTTNATLLRGCVTSANPLTVIVEFGQTAKAPPRAVEAFRPWRTLGWRFGAEGGACDVDAYVSKDGRSPEFTTRSKKK